MIKSTGDTREKRKGDNREKKQIQPGLMITFIIVGSFLFFHLLNVLFPGIMGSWDLQFQDSLFRLRYALFGREKTSSYIIHIAITDRTIAEKNITLGNRETYARLINILKKAGASHIAYDILFRDPVDKGDNLLVEATRDAGNLYYPLVLYEQLLFSTTIPDSAGNLPEPAGWQPVVSGDGALPRGTFRSVQEVISPFPELAAGSSGLGHINMIPDGDGVIRRVPLIYTHKKGYIPALSLRMAGDFLGVRPRDITIFPGKYLLLKNGHFPGGMKRDIKIPIDEQGRLRINFTGPWQDSFYEFSAERLLEAEKDPILQARLRDQIEGAMVLISDISVQNTDKSTGIFDTVYPNSEIHSTIINMILTDRFVFEANPFWSLVLSIIPGIFLLVGALRDKNRWFYTIVVLCVILFTGTTIVVFMVFRILLPVAVLIPGYFFAFLGINVYRFYLKERESLGFSLRADAAENLNQAKNRFFRYISHDLKNPLMPIKGLIPSLLSGTTDTETGEKLLLMQRSAQKLETYIDELMDLVRIDTHGYPITMTQGDIVHFAENIAGLFRITAQKRNITIDLRTEQGEMITWFDRKRMDKVISNLLSNALKFTPKEGTVTLSISGILPYSQGFYPWKWERNLPEGIIRISVKDTGAGIPEKDLPFIFEPFYQSGDPGTGNPGSMGIGLALALEYVNLHYGHITVQSELEKGSEFTIFLPTGSTHLQPGEMAEHTMTIVPGEQKEPDRHQPDAKEKQHTGITTPGEDTTTSAGREILLVVDDDPEIRGFVSRVAGDRFIVIEAADGDEGYDRAVTHRPDIILTDIVMPRCGGIELVKKIKADPSLSGISVVLMTGNTLYEQKGESFLSLADDFLHKGCTGDELLKRLERVLQTRETAPAINREAGRCMRKIDRHKRKQLHNRRNTNAKNTPWPLHPVLIVDDDKDLLQSYIHGLGDYGITNIITEHDSTKVNKILADRKNISLCILDIHMNDRSGMDLLQTIKEDYPDIPVIMASGIKSLETAILCIKQGAFDYIEKPVNFHNLAGMIKYSLKIAELTSIQKGILSTTSPAPMNLEPFHHFITSHPDMYRIFKWMSVVAPTNEHVLILGESGVGKELLAEGIHRASKRSGKYVKVNVAGCDDTLFSDTLFGHKKGAFSGAEKDREGLLKTAHNGTIFLDEIGDLEPKSQVKLLRLLESGEFYPLGSDEVEILTARIITATHGDLKKKVREGLFRRDLENRLSVIEVEIPPLRERLDDLPELLAFFTKQAARSFQRKDPGYEPELIPLLRYYHFPGNVRELKNLVTKAMSKQTGNKPLGPGFFKEYLKKELRREVNPDNRTHSEDFYFSGDFPTLEHMEKLLATEAIKRKKRFNEAALLLGIDRFKLRRLMKKYKQG